ncbi:MAG: transposase [Oscillospiraceae bacterium]|nr:transposase [Clostridia bacterium]MBR4110044.1 transposase [Oscillospiraceae bacterium]MDD6473515.1 excisionase [Bacteroidales bacterium]
MGKPNKEYAVPLWEKTTLTVYEAVALTGIGSDKLRELSDREDCEFVLWNGNKRLFKRKKLEEYLEKSYSI